MRPDVVSSPLHNAIHKNGFQSWVVDLCPHQIRLRLLTLDFGLNAILIPCRDNQFFLPRGQCSESIIPFLKDGISIRAGVSDAAAIGGN